MQQSNDFCYYKSDPKNGNNDKTTAASGDDATRHVRPETRPPSSSLVPISIRLLVDNVVVHDDFYWDKNPTHPTCPLAFAREMADDLNLPEEGAVAIATTIVEQLYGLAIDASPNLSPDTEASKPDNAKSRINGIDKDAATTASSGSKPTSSKHGNNSNGKKRGAWKMDPKENLSMSAQIVAHHRSI